MRQFVERKTGVVPVRRGGHEIVLGGRGHAMTLGAIELTAAATGVAVLVTCLWNKWWGAALAAAYWMLAAGAVFVARRWGGPRRPARKISLEASQNE